MSTSNFTCLGRVGYKHQKSNKGILLLLLHDNDNDDDMTDGIVATLQI